MTMVSNHAIRVLDLHSVDDSGGGADQIVLRTAARLDPARTKATVCCIRCGDNLGYDVDRRARMLGIDYFEVRQKSWWDMGVWASLRRLVQDRRPMIVHAHDYKAAFYARRLARTERLIPMSTAHGWTGNSWRERLVYYPAERMILRTFSRIIAVSSEIRATLIRSGCDPRRVRVVLNGIDPREFRRAEDVASRIRASLGADPGDVVLGAVGRLERQKRFDVLLDAMKLLLAHRPRLRLFVAGDGSLRRDLEDQVRRLGLADRCQLLGHRPDVCEVYQAFEVLVQSSDYEGTPTVLVEAMALEIPVVATDVGGTRELLQQGIHGLLVPPRDPAALAAAIEKTLDDRRTTAERVAAARKRVETDLSFDARMRRLERIYCELASEHRRRHGTTFWQR